jgi:hypothetical protein
VSDKTVAAYNRSDLFERRRRLMAGRPSVLRPKKSETQRRVATYSLPSVGGPMTQPAAPYFDERAVEQIRASLPTGIDRWRLDLLPRVLNHWSVTDLLEYLSREDRATLRRRYDQLTKIEKCANNLRKALGAIDQRGMSWIAQVIGEDGNTLFLASREKCTEMEGRLKDEGDFLRKLATATVRLIEGLDGSLSGRRPRNIRAYLVMMDIVAIFEWLTDRKATREVGRDDHKETGPFWHFAAAVWPYVFGKGRYGLSSAMKNWETWHKRCGEESQLMKNIAIRHPTWGIFNSSSTITPM